MNDLVAALLLGIVEGITEFLPISSTGHLILMVDFLGFKGPPSRIFEVVIQLGAILGVCWVYRARLQEIMAHPFRADNRKLLTLLIAGFSPAAIIGLLGHDIIKSLFDPWVVSIALMIGGMIIIGIERARLPSRIATIEAIPLPYAVAIGFFQALAMIPGTSRSGATIMGARVLGLERKTAAEFSFLLAIPTMLAAAAFDLYSGASAIDPHAAIELAIGFGSAFVTALFAVRWLIGFVGRHSFEPFGWYRIAVGVLLLGVMWSSG